MAMQEVIDGELFRSPGISREIIAADLLYALAADIQQDYHRSVEAADSSQASTCTIKGAYLASWIESRDSKLGYALALSASSLSGEEEFQSLYPVLEAHFFTLDREGRGNIGQPKTVTILNPGMDMVKRVDTLAQTFDTDELEAVSRMIGKTILLPRGDDTLDKDIYNMLAEEHLLELSKLFPESKHTAHEQPRPVRYEHPDFIHAAKQRLQNIQHTDGCQEIAVTKSFNETTYVIHLVAENGWLCIVNALKRINAAWTSETYMYALDDDEADIHDDEYEAPLSQMKLDELVRTLTDGHILPIERFEAYLQQATRDDDEARLEDSEQGTKTYY